MSTDDAANSGGGGGGAKKESRTSRLQNRLKNKLDARRGQSDANSRAGSQIPEDKVPTKEELANAER